MSKSTRPYMLIIIAFITAVAFVAALGGGR